MPRLVYDVDYKVSRVSGGVTPIRDETGIILRHEGVVTTPFGLVEVYAQAGEAGGEFVALSTVIDGREYRRAVWRSPSEMLTPKGLKTVAHRWVRDLHRRLAAGEGEP